MKVINQLLEHLKHHLTRTELENLVLGGFLEPAQVTAALAQRKDTEIEFELTLTNDELDLLPASDSEFELTLDSDPACPESEFELTLEPEPELELLLCDDEVMELPREAGSSDMPL